MSQFKKTRLLSLLLALVMVFTCCGGVLAEEVDDTDEKIQAAQTAMETAEKALNAANEKLDAAEAELKAAEENLAKIKADLLAAGINPDDAEGIQKELDAQKELQSDNAHDLTEAELLVADATDALAVQNAIIQVLDDQIKDIDSDITLHDHTITNNTNSIAHAETELANMDETLASYQAGIDDADKAVEALKLQQADLLVKEADLAALEAQLKEQEALLESKNQTLEDERAAEEAQQKLLDDKQAELEQATEDQENAQSILDTAKATLKYAEETLLPLAKEGVEYAQAALDNNFLPFLTEKLQNALNEAKKELENLEKAIPGYKVDVANAEANLAEAKLATQAAQDARDEEQRKLDLEKAATEAAQAEVDAQTLANEAKQAEVDQQQAVVDAKQAEVEELLKADPEAQKAAAQKAYNDYKANYDTLKAELDKKIEDLKAENEALTTEITTLNAEKDAKNAELTTAKDALPALEAELEACTAAKTELEEKAAEIANKIAELEAELAKVQVPAYTEAKSARDTAKRNRDLLSVAQVAATVAYDEAYSVYMQLIGSTDCAHDKYEMTAFGNTFCLMKVAGLCTHNLGNCCGNLSTGIMANNIKSYIDNGDYQGLANEVQSAIDSASALANVYNELPESVRDTIENALFNLVDSAANKAIDAAKEELKNAISSNVPAENYEAVAAAIDKAAEKIKDIKTALGKGELTEAEVESMLTQAAQSVLNKALNEIKSRIEDAIPEGELEELRAIAEEAVARIEALMAAVDNAGGLQGIVDSFKAEVEKLLADAKDQATAAAKAILNKALTEIKNLVDSAIANSNLDEIAQKVADAIARFEEAIENLPNREELKALISEFRAEVEAAVKAAYEKYSAAAKEHIQEKLAEIKAETEAFVEARIAELKAEIDAFLADKHICEYTMETVKAEVAQKVQAAIDEIKAYIKDKLEAAAGADIEQIKAEVKQVAAAIAAALNVDIDASEIEALIEKIITEIETNGEAFVTDKLQTIENYLDKLFTDAMESNKVTVPGYAPTCYQPGLTDGVACKCGNYVYVEQQEIAATGEHVYSQVGYTAPTCTVEGKVTYRCTTDGCPASYSVKIDAKGHTVVTDAAVEPTCTETGLTEGSHCEVCGEVIVAQTEIPAKGHTLVTLDAVAPTCTETGLTAGEYCEVCDYKVEQTEVPAAGHTLVTDEAVAPTCTETGLTAGEHCTVCDYKVEQTEVPATGHTLVTDEAVAPTCTETGLTAGEHCTVCDYKVEQEVVPATGHTEVTDEAVAPTCTETGLTEGSHCEVCGEVIVAQTEVPATGHTEVTVGVVAATCHTEGYTGDVVCEVCNETIEQGSATAVDPANHDGETELRDVLAPTMREEGYTGDLYCLGCETIIEKGSAVAKLPMEYVSTNVFSVGVELNELVADAKNDTMVTVIDLSVDGVQEFELVTGENLVVGKVIVTVENGMVTVTCDYYSHELFETRKFVNLLTSVDQLTEEAFTKSGFEFGKAVSIQDDLGGSTKVLLVIDNDVSYPVDLEFVSFSADAAYEQLVADMLKILE